MRHTLGFEHTEQEVYKWLNEIKKIGQWNDDAQAYAALRAVLRLLRDHLSINVSAKLSAQLPLLIRGLFYEDWRPEDQAIHERSRDAFMMHLSKILKDYHHSDVDPEQAASAVLKTLSGKIDPYEVEKICAQLPKGIRETFFF